MMNQQDIFKKIGSILGELNEQYEFLAHHPEKLSELELELFLANANFLSDHVEIIKKLNAQLQERQVKSSEKATEKSYLNEEETPVHALKENEPVRQNEVLEAVTVQPESETELQDNSEQEQPADSILDHNFFKPDTEKSGNTFEFDLSNPGTEDQFDYEQKSVEEIFDRPLSKAEEEILAQKKRIHAKDEEILSHTVSEDDAVAEDDEIGPEPFLIHHEAGIADLTENQPEAKVSVESRAEEEAISDENHTETTAEVQQPASRLEEKALFTPITSPKPAEEETVKPTINDLLAKGHSNSNAVPKAPITDLKQAINLNEKLLFIKDLFNGYNLAYSDVIDLLNKMENFAQADAYLQQNYAVKNNWAAKQATVDQFYELLNRRFSK